MEPVIKNVTISIDDELAQAVRIEAAKDGQQVKARDWVMRFAQAKVVTISLQVLNEMTNVFFKRMKARRRIRFSRSSTNSHNWAASE